MSFTYDPAGLSVARNRIRLELGDTNENDYFLHDEEIDQVISEESTFLKRVAVCCRLICSKLAREVQYKLEGFSENAQKIYDRYAEMAQRYGRVAAGSYPWMASTTDADKDTNEDDTDLIQPRFKRDMHVNT